MPALLCYAVLAMNAAAFVAFGVDKARAKRGRRRVPEARLLLLAWLTGLFGAWLGMSVWRHKTQKTSFRLKMGAVSLVNVLWPALYFAWRP